MRLTDDRDEPGTREPTSFPTDIDISHPRGSSRHIGILPTHSTVADVHVGTHITPQRPSPVSTRDHGRPHTQSKPLLDQSHTKLGVDTLNTYRSQTVSSSWNPSGYSQTAHTSGNMTTRRCVEGSEAPPPLDYKKSPYCCVPLPSITYGPDIPIIDPFLAYPDWRCPQNGQNVSQGQSIDTHHYHRCAPATSPRVESATILLPCGRGITVHASYNGSGFVTVGNVLDALDTMLLGKPSREFFPPVEGSYGDLEESCRSMAERTALDSLRSHYVRAGLTRSQEGFDIWDLRIG